MGDTFHSDNYRNIHVPLVLARNQNFLVFETVLIRPYAHKARREDCSGRSTFYPKKRFKGISGLRIIPEKGINQYTFVSLTLLKPSIESDTIVSWLTIHEFFPQLVKLWMNLCKQQGAIGYALAFALLACENVKQTWERLHPCEASSFDLESW